MLDCLDLGLSPNSPWILGLLGLGLESEQSVNSWTSGAPPGLPGVCGIGVALPISHKLLDYREFVGDSLITQNSSKSFQPTLHFYSISPNICLLFSQFLFSGLWYMGSATPPPQTPGLPDYQKRYISKYELLISCCCGQGLLISFYLQI